MTTFSPPWMGITRCTEQALRCRLTDSCGFRVQKRIMERSVRLCASSCVANLSQRSTPFCGVGATPKCPLPGRKPVAKINPVLRDSSLSNSIDITHLPLGGFLPAGVLAVSKAFKLIFCPQVFQGISTHGFFPLYGAHRVSHRYSNRTRPDNPRSSSICLRSASNVLSSCRSMVTEKSIPILRSVPLRSLGRILVPSRFQISGGTSP